ncbi:PH domain-containing protein [Arthrobacter dokdonensis]|uniref:PH domain-containing protein n=1 Tax=Arthrobacter dokdonellae TaxID=2211210 RepID=UPI001494D2EB|nr:PH domain-containing protein [Arthrobacter dokdonellae]
MGAVAGPESLYSTGTRVLASAAWAFCAFFALNLLLTGTAASTWHFLPALALAAWAVFLLLWRPRLTVGADGLTVVNILRSHRIPFGALQAVRVGQSVSLETTAKRIPSWGAPGAGRLGPRLGGRPAGSNRLPATAHTQAAIEAAWNAWERAEKDSAEKDGAAGVASAGDAAQTVATRWDVGHGVVSLVLLAVVAISAAT